MGLLFAFLAALLASASNLFMRLSIGKGGSSRAYLVVQLSFSFLVMILLNPVRTMDFAPNLPSIVLGLIGGVLLGAVMWSLGKSLETGPPGLSLAIINTSSIMPAIMLVMLFGPQYGHGYTVMNGIGSLLVAAGIIWAGWTRDQKNSSKVWLIFVSAVFIFHTLYLIYLQWWAMLLTSELPLSRLLPFHVEPLHIAWFMPAIFLSAAIFQWVIYLRHEDRMPRGEEVRFGLLGGLTNGACAFFLIMAPQVASAWQNAMLFPIFSVGIIVLCNVWAKVLYKEKVNWLANGVCTIGLLLGTVAWNLI
ncbi:MAG: hypothetical protein S4CHLAM81_14040 [Chlamydiales bacterium]|nr:hypothetical protein [Chlamydiales bacterium]MCH9636176.1 hypothetical protein [Chlamydiales bacterium]MCH9703906.1 hypothetical protein [Chlamydiota bacterium]